MTRKVQAAACLTREEHAEIKHRARLCGMQVSPYLRELGLGQPVRTRSSQSRRDVIHQLSRVGRRLERFLRAVEGAGLPETLEDQLEEAVAEAREAFGRLAR